mgnify:CR=1 FL=1
MKNSILKYIYCLTAWMWGLTLLAQPEFVPDNAKQRVGEILFQRPKSVTFAYKNKGNKPLVIKNVVPSCGCTTVDWTKDPVEPGKAGLITAVYDAKMLGTFYKELAVYVEGQDEPIYLSMEGRVVTDMLDYTGDFPIDLGSLRLNANYVEFDNVNRGDHPYAEFQVVNLERTPYRPELMHLPSYLTAQSFPEVIAGGKCALFLSDGSDFDRKGGCNDCSDCGSCSDCEHIVGELLEVFLGDLIVILGDLGVLLHLLELLDRVAADVADGDLAALGILVDLLDELLAALLGELREVQADRLTVVLRVDAEVRLLNGALDEFEGAAVPRGDEQLTRVGRTDGRDLLNGRGRTVIIDHDPVKNCRIGSACSYGIILKFK